METCLLSFVEQILINECEKEKVQTCLPKDEAVEGDSHSPHIQRLEESDKRDDKCKSKGTTTEHTGTHKMKLTVKKKHDRVNQCRLHTVVCGNESYF